MRPTFYDVHGRLRSEKAPHQANVGKHAALAYSCVPQEALDGPPIALATSGPGAADQLSKPQPRAVHGNAAVIGSPTLDEHR